MQFWFASQLLQAHQYTERVFGHIHEELIKLPCEEVEVNINRHVLTSQGVNYEIITLSVGATDERNACHGYSAPLRIPCFCGPIAPSCT